MKAAISAQGKHLDAQTDPRFGRSPYFLIVNIDTLDFKTLANPNVNVVGGAGIQSARLIIEQGVDFVITGSCGPNAFRVLNAANIKIYEGMNGSVNETIQTYKKRRLKQTLTPGRGRHGKRSGSKHDFQGKMDFQDKYSLDPVSSENIDKDEQIRSVKGMIHNLEEQLRKLNQNLVQLEIDNKKPTAK